MHFEQLLTHASDRYADRPAVVGQSRTVSYRELERMALGGAKVLHVAGVRPGEPVILLAPNSVAFLAGYFAILMSGAIVVPVSPDATSRELVAIFDVTEPVAAVMVRTHGRRDYAAELAGHLPSDVQWIDDHDAPEWPSSEDRSVIVERCPDSAGILAFTSGSTGRPKGARHRTGTLMRSAEVLLSQVLDGKAVTSATTFPMHNMGGINMVLPLLLGGGKVVIMDGYRAETLMDAIEGHGVEFIVAIPAMIELLFLKGTVADRDLSSFSRILLSGAPVSNDLCRRIVSELGLAVYVAYGLTEVPGVWLVTTGDTPIDQLGPFVGWPAEGYELAIVDELGQPMGVGELGEVCVRTHYMLLDYIGDDELTAAAIDSDGWLHTGDLGSLRPDGGLFIQGRKKDMYIRGGFNVYPREVEETLMRHESVLLAAVHSIPDPVLGEKGVAWVVESAGAHLDADELRAFASQALSRFKVPDEFRIVGTLPMTPVGKVDKLTLRARVLGEDQTAAS
jgi:acyl-CoA synthetase (AMP-forming)/AMP-acid ligase II